jgi:hypothetical protein
LLREHVCKSNIKKVFFNKLQKYHN